MQAVWGTEDTVKVDSSNTSKSEDSTYKEKKRRLSRKKLNLTIGQTNTKGGGLSVGESDLIFELKYMRHSERIMNYFWIVVNFCVLDKQSAFRQYGILNFIIVMTTQRLAIASINLGGMSSITRRHAFKFLLTNQIFRYFYRSLVLKLHNYQQNTICMLSIHLIIWVLRS